MTLPASLLTPDGTRYAKEEESETPVFWRVNHDRTMWRPNLPEVFRISPMHHVLLTASVQWLWRKINPQLTDEQWTLCLGNTLAFTNGTGFPGHRNWITGAEPTSRDPRMDQARFCGGTILKERFVRDGNLYFEAIDVRKPLPTPDYVMEHPHLYFEAVNIAESLGKPVIRPLKGGWGVPVYVPLFVAQDAYYPVELMTKLEPGATVLPSVFAYP
jgi:hypothetical protein